MNQMILTKGNPMNWGLNQVHSVCVVSVWVVFFCDVAFDVGVMPIVGDWPLGGGRGLFFMQCGMCTHRLTPV